MKSFSSYHSYLTNLSMALQSFASNMFMAKSMVPNRFKSAMEKYTLPDILRVGNISFPLAVAKCFLDICFRDKNVLNMSMEMHPVSKIKNIFLVKNVFGADNEKFDVYGYKTVGCWNLYNCSPVEDICFSIMSCFLPETGCSKCEYSGDDCIHCVNGTLDRVISESMPKGFSFYKDSMPVLQRLIGEERMSAVVDLLEFHSYYISDKDFKSVVDDNPFDWDEKVDVSCFREREYGK